MDRGHSWTQQKGAHIDFLRFSLAESLGPVGPESLRKLFADHCAAVEGVEVLAAFPRHYRAGFKALSGGQWLGTYGMGAGHGRALYELSGRGCEAVKHWGNVYQFARGARPKLTRLDTAVDLFDGELTLDDALARFLRGEFDRRGRHPNHSMLGPWGEPSDLGRTLYIEGGSYTICIYEKGKKDGGPVEWIRFEVRTHSEAELSIEAMCDPDRHWRSYAGPYAYLCAAGAPVQRVKQERAEVAFTRRLEYSRVAAGATVAALLASGFSPEEVCRFLVGDHPGERLSDEDRASARRAGVRA